MTIEVIIDKWLIQHCAIAESIIYWSLFCLLFISIYQWLFYLLFISIYQSIIINYYYLLLINYCTSAPTHNASVHSDT